MLAAFILMIGLFDDDVTLNDYGKEGRLGQQFNKNNIT